MFFMSQWKEQLKQEEKGRNKNYFFLFLYNKIVFKIKIC
jgi:hypothetical protein